MLTSKELRQKYLEFFAGKGHKIIPSASLIPENDPTVLFTTAGMHPLVPYLLGEKHPEGKRLTSVQKCIRTQDIEEVGDNRHETFFEMMGNWSLGDYFKKEAIEWSWEFLTSPKYLGLDPKKLAVSVFAGETRLVGGQEENNIPRDEEATEIWKGLGVPKERIAYLPRKNNWWGPAGQTGPCGPDTEMFYWQGKSKLPPKNSNPGNNEENWLEIWNDVFMQYNKVKKTPPAPPLNKGRIEMLQTTSSPPISITSSPPLNKGRIEEGSVEFIYEPLKQKNVDTGMGLERTLVALNGYADVFQVDTFWPLIQKIEEISGHEYIERGEITKSMRVIADHIRTATMIMGDDKKIAPSNVGQGYIARRMIRRAVRHGRQLGIHENFCDKIADMVIKIFTDVYPELERNSEFIMNEFAKEESKFRNTIEQGIKEFARLIGGFQQMFEKTGKNITEISGKQAFKLFESYGFPLEITLEMARENGLTVNVNGFDIAYKAHQDLSRIGAEQKFKGGLADTGEMSVKYHTASHILLSALRAVLGEHVIQRGSNITVERLRLDFSHPQKLTEEQKKEVEDLVNYAIKHDYQVSFKEMTVSEAKNKGATGVFEDKYGSKIKVYSVGDPEIAPSAHLNSQTFSKEICGGPHVENTGVLGKFKIKKEEAVSSGVRRIKAVLE